MRHLTTWLTILLFCSAGFSLAQTPDTSVTPPRAILIIDDMGNSYALGAKALDLPGNINYAFLPHTPNTQTLAAKAHAKGKEILLHLPMSNLSGKKVGEGQLSPALTEKEFRTKLANNLEAVPYAKGVNNHMGSLLTQLKQPMAWLMSELKTRQLYFVDSRTSPLTVAQQSAQRIDLPNLRRDVFLDNVRSFEAISQQVEQWLTLAEHQGQAVAIGHPHPETLDALEKLLPTLEQRGIHLVLLSDALKADTPMAEPPSTPTIATNQH